MQCFNNDKQTTLFWKKALQFRVMSGSVVFSRTTVKSQMHGENGKQKD